MEYQIGDRVFIVADNIGFEAVIVDERDSNNKRPSSRWKVRPDDGKEFWAYDFEISRLIRRGNESAS